MNTRLQQFLDMERLQPSAFADMMGVQRSGISHLLSGRNKPSFDFIQKMLTKFPDLNYEWLILGKGKPYKSSEKPLPTPAAEAVIPDLFSSAQMVDKTEESIEVMEDNHHNSNEIASISDMASFAPAPHSKAVEAVAEIKAKVETKAEANPAAAKRTSPIQEQARQKSISRIIIFYDDGTYEER